MSRARTDLLLKISLYNSILQVGAFVVGGLFSIDVLIKLYLIANVFMFVPNMYLAVRKLGGLHFFLSVIIRPLLAAAVMAVLLMVLSDYIDFIPWKVYLRLF